METLHRHPNPKSALGCRAGLEWFWILCLTAYLLGLPVLSSAERKEMKIPVPYDAVRKESRVHEKELRGIVRDPDAEFSLRGETIEAPERVFLFFMDRPILAAKILEEYGASGIAVEKAEEEKETIEITEPSGFRADVEEAGKTEGKRVYLFRYAFRSPLGIGIRFGGEGALLIRHVGNDKKGETTLDLDVYLRTGTLPLDRAAREVPPLLAWYFQTKLEEYLGWLTDLCERVAEGPEDVYEEIKDAEGFTPEELSDYRRYLLPQKVARSAGPTAISRGMPCTYFTKG